MKRYLVATQHAWGQRVFDLVSRDEEAWVLRRVDDPKASVGPSLAEVCAQVDPRYVFLVHWSDYVPVVVFDRWETVNLHCTPLPYGRGGHPIENLLLAGFRRTLMTAHRVVADLDAGPIYGVNGPIAIDKPTKQAILDGFIEPCARLIRDIVATEPTPYPQTGRVVRFSRLSRSAYAQFWERRAKPVETREMTVEAEILARMGETRKKSIAIYAEMAQYCDAATVGFKARDPEAPDVTLSLITLAFARDPERTRTLLRRVIENDTEVVRLTCALVGDGLVV